MIPKDDCHLMACFIPDKISYPSGMMDRCLWTDDDDVSPSSPVGKAFSAGRTHGAGFDLKSSGSTGHKENVLIEE